jgi:hypothetical protein
MIKKEFTHRGLGHTSYGLLAMIPDLEPLQIWGLSFVLDKILNYNEFAFPNGVRLFNRTSPWTKYSLDNVLVDNNPLPKTWYGVAVNFIPVVILSALSWIKYLPFLTYYEVFIRGISATWNFTYIIWMTMCMIHIYKYKPKYDNNV